MKIKIMSYNTQHCLNYITREIDYDLIADTIKKCEADIIGLQEIRDKGKAADYEAQAKIIAEKLGYHYYFAEAIRLKSENPYGNALISHYPIISAETIVIAPKVPKERHIEDFDKYDDMTKSGEITVAEACKRMNIAPATFYRLRRLRENPEKK